MTVRRLRPALLLAAAVPLAAAMAAAALKASRIAITARPRPNCPHCHGEGGWWTGGAFHEMEPCGCWSNRRTLRIRFLPVPARDELPF